MESNMDLAEVQRIIRQNPNLALVDIALPPGKMVSFVLHDKRRDERFAVTVQLKSRKAHFTRLNEEKDRRRR